jgi:hypothetical protein
MAVSRINEAGLDVNQYGNRNLIINGAMEVAQRGTAAHNEGSGYFSLDRWYQQKSNQDQFTYSVEQVSDGPSGFSKCLRVTTSTAETALASDEFGRIYQAIEGQNLVRVGFGTADAKPLTVSFYVKSSITGNFSCSLYINDANVVYSQAYTINAANTWEYKTLSIPAYTTAGPNLDNTQGAILNFGLFAGSGINTATTNWTSYSTTYLLGGQTANLAATLNDSWRITGVQLEVGDTATDFEHRTFADELTKCKRYFEKVAYDGGATIIGGGMWYSSVAPYVGCKYKVTKRTVPTVTSATDSNGYTWFVGGSSRLSSAISFSRQTSYSVRCSQSGGLSGSGGTNPQATHATWLELSGSGTSIEIDAEL